MFKLQWKRLPIYNGTTKEEVSFPHLIYQRITTSTKFLSVTARHHQPSVFSQQL